MNADVKGALRQINKSWRCFAHNDKPMTKQQVFDVLTYAVKKGYESTRELSDFEVENIIKNTSK